MSDNLFADLSSNNSGFSAKSYVEAGHLAVAIKATEGFTYINPKYKPWLTDAHKHKLAVFHYCFCRPENGNPDAQAKHFWDTVKPHFRRPGDYVVMDVETGAAQAKTFTTEFDRHLTKISGTHPVLYTFKALYDERHLSVSSGRVWLAAWGQNNPAGKDWDLPGPASLWAWQFTDGQVGPEPHSLKGVTGPCDVSHLNPKTTSQLRAALRH